MRLITLFLSFFLLLSCSKNTRQTNKIHGKWTITSITGSHYTGPVSGTMEFNKCDIPKKDYRTFREEYSWHLGDSTVHVRNTGAYTFQNNGKTLVIEHTEDELRTYTVKEQDKNDLILEHVTGSGAAVTITLKK